MVGTTSCNQSTRTAITLAHLGHEPKRCAVPRMVNKAGRRSMCNYFVAFGRRDQVLSKKSENKAGADSNRLRPPNLPRTLHRYVRGLPCFLVSLPLLQFGPCYTC